ncbi:Disease resistance protein [Artemisia annua]|uniref:Disease resistance protein n=1 Tax=Artemisia annua TaxID=35608 RepID=A0A2U1N1J1_ARTAN|nr:Disease resistance protein [Artemisia annua]
MADPFTSALVSDVVGKLTSAAFQEVGLLWGLENDLLALNNTFRQIQGVLYDAEMRQTNEKGVEEWLKTLKSASLEVENVLDEASTEAMIQSLDSIKHKVRTYFSTRHNPLVVKTRIAHKVKNIREKLEVIDANRSRFQLTPTNIREDAAGIGSENSNGETSSLMSKICGRDEEKKMIVDKICNPYIGITRNDDDVRVYAIWGMGGIGKTTLAQYVFNHEMVKTHFELKCWVYVSAVFDVQRIVKQIIKVICGPEDLKDLKLDEMSLDDLQIKLQNKLTGKKYFIVTDDVWIENKDMKKWDELCKALRCGTKGSTVMVTTRKKDTAQLMAKIPELQHNVAFLSEEESWSLFKMLAFPGGREGENVRELELVGREIVEKCKGLPLAVKTLGSLMSTKEKVNEWQLVNDKFVSEMQDNGILTALRLSYDDLPPHMKICFAYCCVYSKGWEMSKNSLIELWMANGFIPSQGDVSLYMLGEEIFSCLVRRSFFQDVVEKNETCKMHDFMHDLARNVMRHDCAVIEPSKELITSDEVLHVSLSCHGFRFSKLDLKKLRSLRSMLVFDDDYQSSIKQISSHVYLRVLYLNKIKSSTFLNRIKSSTLPESICKLIHLRYLKIYQAYIEVLPESIINLQNLQTLILEDCRWLRELPKGMRYMRNLQRLDTNGCDSLWHMPVGIKELTNLRRLSQFVVGKEDGARIGELGNLNLLGWDLKLKKLQNVRGLRDAKSANLKDKTNLKSLILYWSFGRSEETNDSEVVEGLEPNSGLQELKIERYMGRVLSPSWLVKLVNLTSIKFSVLKKCEQLPPLGKLPSLKRIQLEWMDSLECFHDEDNSTSKDEILFLSLQELEIRLCPSLVSLPTNFPKLQSLEIYSCQKLRSLPDDIQSFKDLNQITIHWCEILRRRCEEERGEDWPKISHIPHLNIRSLELHDGGKNEDKDEDSETL